jgi:hypothetical protein
MYSKKVYYLDLGIIRKETIAMVIIKWTNKFSNETGYVASLSTKNKCFYNTFEQSEAKHYSEKSVTSLMKMLDSFHETDDNSFEVITVQ